MFPYRLTETNQSNTTNSHRLHTARSRTILQIWTGRLYFISPQSRSSKIVGRLIYFHHILGKHGRRGWRVWIFGEDSLRFIPQPWKTAPVLFPCFEVAVCQSAMLRIYLLMACSSSVMPVSLNARLDSSRLRAMALCRSSLSSPVRSITSTQTHAHTDKGTLNIPLHFPLRALLLLEWLSNDRL